MEAAMKKFLIKFGLRRLKSALKKERYKEAFVKAVNKRVDIPKLDESQERKLFNSLYKSIVDALVDVVDNAL